MSRIELSRPLASDGVGITEIRSRLRYSAGEWSRGEMLVTEIF